MSKETETENKDWLAAELEGGTEEDHSLKVQGDEFIPEDDNEDGEIFEDGEVSAEDDDDATPESEDKAQVEAEDSEAESEVEGAKGETKTVSQAELDALKRENETLQKRLHDTQSAYHKATKDRAAIAKELEEAKSKAGGNDDDWFSDDDDAKERVEKLEAELKRADDELERKSAEVDDASQKAKIAAWDEAAAPVIAKYDDFKTLVYDELTPLLDEKTGNPSVRKEFMNLPADKRNPEGFYEFAKKIHDRMEFERDPEAYRERIRKEAMGNNPRQSEEKHNSTPTGKKRLDMTNSVSMDTTGNTNGFDVEKMLFGGR